MPNVIAGEKFNLLIGKIGCRRTAFRKRLSAVGAGKRPGNGSGNGLVFALQH